MADYRVGLLQSAVANLVRFPADHPAWELSYEILSEFMQEIEKEKAEHGRPRS